MADIVLIAPSEHLASLREHSSFAGAQAFPDGDALKALETITKDKPKLIVLERTFAATSRGAALIKRIKADPALVGCEVKIVAHDGISSGAKKQKTEPAAASALEAAVDAAAAPAPVASKPLDQRGTRRAPRFVVVGGIEVMIDGNPATLVNLSVVGAQVISPTILRPNQRVRMVLPDSDRQLRFAAGIAWAAMELPKGGPQYRAGVEFFDAEPDPLDKFIELNKK